MMLPVRQTSDQTIESALIAVTMDGLTTDKKVRDENMKTKLFETSEFPESTLNSPSPSTSAQYLKTAPPMLNSPEISPSRVKLSP